MVGLILVMQCVQGAGGAGSARGVLVFCTPSSLPVSACKAGGYFPIYSGQPYQMWFWTTLDNKPCDWAWFTCANLQSPLTVCCVLTGTVCSAMWAISKSVQVCGKSPEYWITEDWKTFDLKIILYIFRRIIPTTLFFLILPGWGVTCNPRFSDFRLFFPHPVISGSHNTQKSWLCGFPQTNDIINED